MVRKEVVGSEGSIVVDEATVSTMVETADSVILEVAVVLEEGKAVAPKLDMLMSGAVDAAAMVACSETEENVVVG